MDTTTASATTTAEIPAVATTTSSSTGTEEWNPTMTLTDIEVYSRWLSRFRDFGGKLHKQKPKRIFVIQEGNQSGPFWRLLWPKNADKPEEQWWQAMRIEPHVDDNTALTMKTLEDGAQVTIEGVEGRVERTVASEKFSFWFVPTTRQEDQQ